MDLVKVVIGLLMVAFAMILTWYKVGSLIVILVVGLLFIGL